MPEEVEPTTADTTVGGGAGDVPRLWERWRQQQCPDFGVFEPGVPWTAEQMLALLRYDQRERWRSRQRFPAEAYLQRYRVLRDDEELARAFIYSEFLLRQELGEAPQIEEYLWRFPQQAEALRQQHAFQQELDGLAAAPSDRGPHHPEVAPPSPGIERWPSVPGYAVLGELGRGGHGVVYQARHLALDRLVALKMLRDDRAEDGELLARFRREAEAVARLQHPHLVQVYDIGEWQPAEGQRPVPYCALEYVAGGSLEKHLQGQPQPARLAAHLVETLARAMHAVHQQGIVHRDLKPANILLVSGGVVSGEWSEPSSTTHYSPLTTHQAKITDFGLAKRLDVGVGPTQTGAVMGTPSYMAPEQARGDNKTVGAAADVYALGAILYELLTGRPPFQGESPFDVLQQVVSREPVAPRILQPKVSRDLETICLKCLEKDPRQRYVTAEALAEDLQHFREGRPITARPVGVVEQGWRWCRRNPVVAGLLLAVAMSLLIGTGVAAYFGVQATAYAGVAMNRAVEAETNAQRADREADQTRRAKRELAQRLYIADMRLAQRAWDDNRIGRLRELLEGQRPERTDGEDLRGFEWYYWWRLCHTELLILKGHTGRVEGVAFSPDGRRLATASWDNTTRVWDTATGQELFTLNGHTSPHAMAFSPDGRRLATASWDNTTRVWDTATGQELFTLNGHTSPHAMAFSPDGRRLATASWDNTARVWDAATGQELLTLKGHTDDVYGVAFSRDGRRLATASGDQTARVWDAATGQELVTLNGHTDAVLAVTFRGDGRRLATASRDHTARVWDAVTGQALLILEGHTGPVSGVGYSPDGHRLATASWDKTARVWDAVTGQELLTLKGHIDSVYGVAFSRDGRRLATASQDQTARVWDAITGQELLTLKGHTSAARGVAFAPDGRRVATVSDDKTARVWEVANDQELGILQGHTARVSDVVFSPDGRRLATVSGDRTARVWDAATGQQILTLTGHTNGIHGVAYSPDGRLLATASDDETARVWDAVTGKEIFTLQGHTDFVHCVAFRSDGRRLVTASEDQTARVWDLATGQELLTLEGHTSSVYGATFSRDGRQLATASEDQTARVWDAVTGKELLILRGHTSGVIGVAFSPDGRRLATASRNQTARVWDAATGKELLALQGHAGGVARVVFSGDGRRLATASSDNTARVWDAATGQELLTLKGHTDHVYGVAFSGDGRRLATASEDQTVRVWETDLLPAEARRERFIGRLVPRLWREVLLKEELLARLRAEQFFTEAERAKVLAMAERYPPQATPDALNDAGWEVVRRPGADATAYALALRQAEAACRLRPDDSNLLNTLGVSQYRLGRYAEALASLTSSSKLHVPRPEDLAFLAMTYHRLGQPARARDALARLRKRVTELDFADDEEAQSFLREAADLLEGTMPRADP
jgi:WD40 repeat protein/serine/threonine protein kinase